MSLLPYHNKILRILDKLAEEKSQSEPSSKEGGSEAISLTEMLQLVGIGLVVTLPALLLVIGILVGTALLFLSWFHP